jgi:sulfur carrier protein ThiS adenylyltransferase
MLPSQKQVRYKVGFAFKSHLKFLINGFADIMIRVNEKSVEYENGMRLADLVASIKPGSDVFIINGYPLPADTLVQDGDECWLIKRGDVPNAEEMEHLLYSRHTPGVQKKIKGSTVGIMGLGGLGSVVAVALARVGVGALLLADYDVVEPSNLNRQQYFVDQVGMKKTKAMQVNLARINPYVKVELFDGELTEDNIPLIFKDVDVLAECFDGAEIKAGALRTALTRLPGTGYVGASGMAGFGENNLIKTKKLYDNIYVIGDHESEAQPGQGLMAPRVGIAAHHQANQILRILLNLE